MSARHRRVITSVQFRGWALVLFGQELMEFALRVANEPRADMDARQFTAISHPVDRLRMAPDELSDLDRR
jgi:hypothetical protein